MRAVIIQLCFAILTCSLCYAIVPFQTLRQYQTGLYSTGICSADVDGDGDIDLVVANRGTNDVSVMYNDGNGLYPTIVNFPTGQTPRYVHAADFDGDGDIDLCTPDYTGMTETVLQNDGNGVFTIQSQYPFRTPAFSWVDDIDSDGFSDILVLHWDENADPPSQNPALFTPLINNGDGTFVAYPSSWIGKQPRGGASADLNGDGFKDVVVTNYVSHSISIVLATGNRQWADEIPILLSGAPRYVVLGDFDNDSDIDIAVVDKTDNNLWILHNDGAANFTLVETSVTNGTPHSIDAGDIDLDGDLDLIVSHVASAQQLLFLNDGTGLFPVSQSVFMTAGPAEVKFADVNNDGWLDIVTANVNWTERGASVLIQGACDGSDCNNNGIGDICDLPDCNNNMLPDECDISSGFSTDFDGNAIPDECQDDCNGNGVPDAYEILTGAVNDCNLNGLPDDCDWPDAGDCDQDGVIDGCEVDSNGDFIPDDCQCLADFSGNGIVAIEDILMLIAAWGPNPVPHGDPVPEDINVDLVVDIQDLLQLIASWGECSQYTIPSTVGACCLSNSFCVEINSIACGVRHGVYLGDNTTCGKVDCANP